MRQLPPEPITALGQSRRFGDVRVTSALPLKADIHRKVRHVSKVPQAEVKWHAITSTMLNDIVQ
jgi:hypothetical protein